MITDDSAGTPAHPTLGAVLLAHARGYAQAVRLQLEDLGPEVVDELTDGLEADLAEALTDAVAPLSAESAGHGADDDVALDLVAHFGPAESYAAELRAAAGLPGPLPGGGRRRGRRRTFAARWALLVERWRRAWSPVTSTPQWARLRRLGDDVRPVWWVARGWIVGALLVAWSTWNTDGQPSLVPERMGELLVMGGCALVSVQWARGRWLPRRWQPRLTVAASVVAVLMVPAVASATHDESERGSSSSWGSGSYDQGYAAGRDEALNVGYGEGSDGDGVWVDGMQVSNLFAYDAHGDPIKDVQLFDDRGRPVRTVTSVGEEQAWSVPDVESAWYFRPRTADDGRERWNVYPMRAVPEEGMEWSEDGSAWQPQVGVQPEEMPWPFLKAPTSVGDAGSEVPTEPPPGPSSTPEPEKSPSSRSTTPPPGKGGSAAQTTAATKGAAG